MDAEKLRQAYGDLVAAMNADRIMFTSVRTGERGTSEYFEAKWRAAHPPILSDNVVVFPVPEPLPVQSGELPNLAVAGS